ncbi:hypothetical protein Vafri_13912 [Volvox africanus]|nr:hypothetical protein Vafri_13912 [Volvox africanus]
MSCRKVLDSFGTGGWFKRRHLMAHASHLMCGGDAEQASGVVCLLGELVFEKASEMLLLQRQAIIVEIVKLIPCWSQKSRVPTSTAAIFLDMLPKILSMFSTLALCGGAEFCRKLHKANLTAALLELVADHSQMQQVHQPKDSGTGSAVTYKGHEAVVNSALALLTFMLSQVPAQRLDFDEIKGVQGLLRLLNNEFLNSSVQGTIVKLLTVAASSFPKIGESVKLHGFDTVKKLLRRYLTSWLEAPSGSSMMACSPDLPLLSPAAACCSPEVVEPLLQLFALVASSSSGDVLADGGLQLLEAALRGGLATLGQEGHKVAVAATQALFRLSCDSSSSLLDAALCGGTTISLMTELVDLACERIPITTVTDAQVVHGGVCAQGFLSKVIGSKLHRGEVSKAEVLCGSLLPKLTKLLCHSTEAVLVAANAVKAQYPAPVGPQMAASASGVCCAGHAYLAQRQVGPDMRVAVTLALRLLTEFSQDFDSLQVLRAFKMQAALERLKLWQATKCLASQLVSKLSEIELEYQPYHLYGNGILQAAVLRAVQLDVRPFDEKGVSAAKLLKLSGHQLRTWLGLDPTEISQVVLIQEANRVFTAIDKMDCRVDGCIIQDDLEQYLVRTFNMREDNAESLSRTTFEQMQVDARAPASFLDFVKVFAILKGQLEEDTAECRATKRCRR